MEVPLSSMLMGFSLINPPILVSPIYGNPHLVGGLEHFLFLHILGIIIPID